MFRIGYGFDVHRFGGSHPFILGGVHISDIKKISAHSDGDVMIHALIDALLGAASYGDIGTLFPDTDVKYAGINSRKLLRFIWGKIMKKGFSLGNIDITVILQIPKIRKYILDMRCNIAEDLNCLVSNINVKATTTEMLGYIGRSEGVACVATVLLLLC